MKNYTNCHKKFVTNMKINKTKEMKIYFRKVKDK